MIKPTFNLNSLDEFILLLLNSNFLQFNQSLNSITTKNILIQENTSKVFDLLKIYEMQYLIELSFNLIRNIFNKFDQSKDDMENIKVRFFNYLKDNKPNPDHVICFYNFKDACDVFRFSVKSKKYKLLLH